MSKMPIPGPDPHTYPNHSGIDFLRGPKNLGAPIRASGPGVVLRTPKNAKGGQWTTIRYDVGVTVGYAHQDRKPPVKKGDRVSEGTIIGFVGQTGTRVTGPHVHVEIIGDAVDAAVWKWFDRDRVVSAAPTPAGELLTVDGIYGPATARVLLAQLTALGVAGRTVDHKLQAFLNSKKARDWQGKALKVDGVALRNNVKKRVPLVGRWRSIWALQDYLGTTKDGVLNRGRSTVISILQRRLNTGGL